MFDVAYLPEASVEAARIEKSKLWDKILKSDLSKPLAGFTEMLEMCRYNDFIAYYGLIYNIHGGI